MLFIPFSNNNHTSQTVYKHELWTIRRDLGEQKKYRNQQKYKKNLI